METTADKIEIVRMSQNESNMPNSPIETTKWHPDEPNGCRSHADGLSACTHTYCVGNDMQTAADEAEHIRMSQK